MSNIFRQIFEIKKQTKQKWQLLIDNGGAPIKFSKLSQHREISVIYRGREVVSADQPLVHYSRVKRVRPERWK